MCAVSLCAHTSGLTQMKLKQSKGIRIGKFCTVFPYTQLLYSCSQLPLTISCGGQTVCYLPCRNKTPNLFLTADGNTVIFSTSRAWNHDWANVLQFFPYLAKTLINSCHQNNQVPWSLWFQSIPYFSSYHKSNAAKYEALKNPPWKQTWPFRFGYTDIFMSCTRMCTVWNCILLGKDCFL